jgi:hypothetical protein
MQPSLSYCNRCGTKVNASFEGEGELTPRSLLNAIFAIFAFGMVAFVALMFLMKEGTGFNPILLVAGLLTFAVMLALESVLLWLLLKKDRRRPDETNVTETAKGPTTNELADRYPLELPEPLASVTEHTTRAFDPIPSKQKSR